MSPHAPDLFPDNADDNIHRGKPPQDQNFRTEANSPREERTSASMTESPSPDEVIEPLTAKLIDTRDDQQPRVGSPFAVDPLEPPNRPIELLYDVGPLRYTAMGAVAAAIIVLGFALIGVWWFPAGGAMIAALGCMLSIFGLYSTFRYTAAGLLTVYLCLFVASYGRSFG